MWVEIFGELLNMLLEGTKKIKLSEKITHEVLERIGENRTLLNNILRRKVN